MLSTPQIMAKYGQPGDLSNLVSIVTPYPFRIAWDLNTFVRKITCHKMIANDLTNVFSEVLRQYGPDELRNLGIDIYGGCFNYRKMRNGKDWSRHSWGIAIDLHPDKNQLKWGKDKALFAKPEYDKLHTIFEANGFLNLGRVKNYDWMHWEKSE